MTNNRFTMLKLGVVGCTMLAGLSGAIIPLTGNAAAASAEQATAIPMNTPIPKASIPATHPSSVAVKEVILISASKELKTNMKVPQLTGMRDTTYQAEMNDIIFSHANKDMANWEKEAAQAASDAKANGFTYRPYELTITYELKSDGSSNPAGVISLEVTTYGETGGTGMPRVDTYNVFNGERAQLVRLQDLLGDNFKEIVNTGVLAKMDEDPQNYFKNDFKGINEEQGFFVEKGEAVVIFPKYAIAPGSTGSRIRFSLPENVTITPNSLSRLPKRRPYN
ncbi:DUF3298 and DUF4163 domain-containing protein [Paenibacillus sp. N3.4]|uniref:DUF3298 and DUF4163 domain-containing protein n=1 Tax=Paenibacillus sp. N3.4 TaxID=2603222 RepID=UPI00164FA1B2|nr:DUF3298 and DUF4163 domain-containing protein [Paenibacillus sp. N3.4]